MVALVDSSSRLFAACRVLLRFCLPRHPPCALISFVLAPRTGFRAAVLFRITLQLVRFQSFCSESNPPRWAGLRSQVSGCKVHAMGHKKAPQSRGRSKGTCHCCTVMQFAAQSSFSARQRFLPVRVVKSWLLYTPWRACQTAVCNPKSKIAVDRVGDSGLEPEASPLSEECSNQLS